MWCCTGGDSYSKLEDDHENDEIDRGVKKCVNNNFNYDSSELDQLGDSLTNGSNTGYLVVLTTNSKYLSLDTLPKDILIKVAFHLGIRDLMCLENTNKTLREFVLQYWKIFCERSCIVSDPTPLCVGWPLNALSLYSFDNAAMFCQDPIRKWRVAATRSLLVGTFCCVICGQHLKDRMSVDGIYFNHDVLLCFPDCYHIFTVNINGPVV